jgi:hypothetical protein
MAKAYRESWSNEVCRYERCCDGVDRDPLGLHQFFEFESCGVRHENPSPYMVRLLNGKRWWEWTVNSIAQTYGTDEWQGWAVLEQDFKNDAAGLAQIKNRCGVR